MAVGFVAGGSAVKPVMAAAAAPSTDLRGEEDLVARAMAGSSEAFEILFKQYRERITAYVRTIIPNHSRAEDVVQEIFVSALRKIHTLQDPAAFKPWIYEIARNASVDDVRRVKRNGEILIRSNDFGPFDEQRQRQSQSAYSAVTWKERINHLKEALGGLPESQHEALLLREFGGMSYDEIGERMNLSRPAVESMLFRARRGLKDEYGEITTGRRCRRMQRVMAEIGEGLGGMRDRRLLLRHMRECDSCRREAAALGFTGIAVPPETGRLRRGVSRVAALLPLPFLFNRRPEGSEQVTAGGSSFGVQAQSLATQVSAAGNVSADHVSSAIHKAAAVVAAVAVIGGGAGVAVKEAGVKVPVVNEKPKSSSVEDSGAKGAASGTAAPVVKDRAGSPTGAKHAEPGSAAETHGAAAPGASAPLGTAPGEPGLTAAPDSGSPGSAPADGSTPSDTAPATDTPADTGSSTPSGDTGSGGGGSSGDTSSGDTSSGDTSTGDTSPGTSDTASNDSTSAPAADQPPSTGGTPSDTPNTDLPPGWQTKIDSGAATLDDLPPGLAKKVLRVSSSA
jgi:RNA polymerase sigma factor (sigma-70 family)